MAKLTARAVETKNTPGYYGDGGGLYLQVRSGGARSWVYRFQLAGRRRDMGLGPVDTVTLAEARDRAHAARKLVRDGSDPIEAKRAADAGHRLEQARAMTFKEAAEAYICSNRAGWKNAKHSAQWDATLKAYAYPVFGAVPVAGVDVTFVTKALEPIWTAKTETAGRVRQRIERVLDWARARGYRSGDNPARWKGHLDQILPARAKVRKAEHHAALPYAEIGDFMAKLRDQDGVSARALEFVILTAARTGEAIGARWDEINFETEVWTIPAARMKAGREHRVPLSAPAIDVLRKVERAGDGVFVFPGGHPRKPLSNMAMLKLLERMERDDLTVHGFRLTFRDWVAEKTNYPREVAEMALAHAVGDKVEAAYRRGDLFEKRRAVADAWARFCGSPSGESKNVLPLAKRVQQ